MGINILNRFRNLSASLIALILLSCSESPADNAGEKPLDLQVVTNSTTIKSDEAVKSSEVIGIRDELIIGNAETMNLQYPQQTIPMSAYANSIISQPQTKTYVKPTIRRASVKTENTEKIFAEGAIDIHAAIASLIESLRDRLKDNQSIHITIELWFDPMSENDFHELYRGCPYSSSILSGENLK